MGGVLDWTATSLQPHSPGWIEERHLGRDRYPLSICCGWVDAFVEGNHRSFIKLKLTLGPEGKIAEETSNGAAQQR